jgi:hypothetical protein
MTIKEISFAVENALGKNVSIKWHTSFEPDIDKQNDPIFYEGLGLIATVSSRDVNVDIYADGIVRVDYHHPENKRTLYTTADFLDVGLDTDEKLREAGDFLDWGNGNNNWFDLYQNGEHLDCVHHNLYDIISQAGVYVRDEQSLIDAFENLTI